MRAAMRTRANWLAWCASSGVAPLASQPTDVATFLYAPSRSTAGKTDAGPAHSVPLPRWNYLRWLALHAGAPVEALA